MAATFSDVIGLNTHWQSAIVLSDQKLVDIIVLHRRVFAHFYHCHVEPRMDICIVVQLRQSHGTV